MKKVTHASVWKDRPKEKHVFVSNFVGNTLKELKSIKPKKILDVACGNGMGVTLPLARLGYEVHSFDHTKSGVNATNKNLKDENFKPRAKLGDLYKDFKYKSNSFDAVYCFQAIYHGRLEQIMKTLSEIKRVLKPGGYLFATFLKYEDIEFDKQKKRYYFWVKPEQGKKFKSWLKSDPIQLRLFYFLDKNWEYLVPHYYIKKNELSCLVSQYFDNVKVKSVKKPGKFHSFWLVSGKK